MLTVISCQLADVSCTTASGYLNKSITQCVTLLLFPTAESVKGHFNGNKRKQLAWFHLKCCLFLVLKDFIYAVEMEIQRDGKGVVCGQ